MKKLLFITFILSLLVLSGCGKEKETTKTTKELIPTVEDVGWEMIFDKEQNINEFDEEYRSLLINKGFKEGYTKIFINEQNLERMIVHTTISSKEGIDELLELNRKNIEKGERRDTQLIEIRDIQIEDIQVTEGEIADTPIIETEEIEIITRLSLLKNPKIGDESVMWRETSNMGLRLYNIAFVKKNVYVMVSCNLEGDQDAIKDCIEYAELVEEKI